MVRVLLFFFLLVWVTAHFIDRGEWSYCNAYT